MASLFAEINWTMSIILTVVLSVVATVVFNVLMRKKK
jgi:cbb3-type cytochrome oxidase subunit 1